ncbi:MAG TPA: hypothetical protein VNH15_03475 [Elusimicrobiota bacterium]|nr:hypothetical protein [Elusimicrobiota bacterium]
MTLSRGAALWGLAALIAATAALPAGAQTDAAFFAQLGSLQAQALRPGAAAPAAFPPGLLFTPVYAVQKEAQPLGAQAPARQDLVRVSNDDSPSSFMEFSLGLDAAGGILDLSFASSDHPDKRQDFPIGGPIRSCSVRGSPRLGENNSCGVELCHAIFSTSAIRLLAPDVDPKTGGVITIIYLKHYSIFGKSREAELNLDIRKTPEGWGLYLPKDDVASASQRVDGLFIHRGSRGISAFIACLGGVCPASWARPYQQNNGLPPVYNAPGS